jgi:hypothetical protein
MHVPDWDPRLLADFDSADYVRTIAQAGFQSLMHVAKSHVGLCLWRTKIGPEHANMRGRDYFGEVMEECRRYKLRAVAYYSLIYDLWNFDHHPDWRLLPEKGYDEILKGRPAQVCPNSPYRYQALAELRELVGNYDFDGIFLDMTFWRHVCYCPHCTARFREECNTEPPRTVNWDDPTWRKFQMVRQQWLLEFASLVTKTIKNTRPITVSHQFATCFFDWSWGVPLQMREACDYLSGDFYGGPTEYSLVCKAFFGLSPTRPFEFMTSRTIGLGDFETTKTFDELLTSADVPKVHSAACLIIDAINPNGTLNHAAYDFLREVNTALAPSERFLGGELAADVAIYYDKESLYDPRQNGVRVSEIKSTQPPHLAGVIGAARILRQTHIPFGLITNVTLDQLRNYRAVIVPNVLEMTAGQAMVFRKFVEDGGVLYASGPSSLDRFDPHGPRFLLEDVFGVEFAGTLGTTWTYLTPQDEQLKKIIWPQDALTFTGRMIQVKARPGVQVLATVTLPFVSPQVGNCLNMRFAQFWSNPPAMTPGTNPGLIIHSYGSGQVIWVAAPIESTDHPVNIQLVSELIRRVLAPPYRFEVDTTESVEMTLFHQPGEKRFLTSLLKMDYESSPAVAATVRVRLGPGQRAARVIRLPDQKALNFEKAGPYVQFHLEPFEILAMALVEYQ